MQKYFNKSRGICIKKEIFIKKIFFKKVNLYIYNVNLNIKMLII